MLFHGAHAVWHSPSRYKHRESVCGYRAYILCVGCTVFMRRGVRTPGSRGR